MRSMWVGALVVAACSSKPAVVPDAMTDAAPDAGSNGLDCDPGVTSVPVTITGMSPHHSLDVFHYANVGFVSGFCPDAYIINFTPDGLLPSCNGAPWLQLAVFPPFTTGSNRARADLIGTPEDATDNVTFEATTLDQPDAMPAHIVGHFVSHDPAWSFDIAVDMTSQSSTDCI